MWVWPKMFCIKITQSISFFFKERGNKKQNEREDIFQLLVLDRAGLFDRRDRLAFLVQWQQRQRSHWPQNVVRKKTRLNHTIRHYLPGLIFFHLTPSLPWCHLKTTHESAQFETFKPFCFLFGAGRWKDFHTTHSTESRCVIGPENTLFAGVCMHLSARKFYRLGQWRG